MIVAYFCSRGKTMRTVAFLNSNSDISALQYDRTCHRGTDDRRTTRIIYTKPVSYNSARTVLQQERGPVCYSGSGCFDQNNRVLEPARRFALSLGRFLVTTSWTTLDTIYRSVVSMICAIEQFAVTSVVAHRFQSDFHVLRRFYRRGTFVNH